MNTLPSDVIERIYKFVDDQSHEEFDQNWSQCIANKTKLIQISLLFNDKKVKGFGLVSAESNKRWKSQLKDPAYNELKRVKLYGEFVGAKSDYMGDMTQRTHSKYYLYNQLLKKRICEYYKITKKHSFLLYLLSNDLCFQVKEMDKQDLLPVKRDWCNKVLNTLKDYHWM